MFFCNSTINTRFLNPAQKPRASQFKRTFLILALLTAGISATQGINPAQADDNSEAMAKILKQRSLSENANASGSGANATGSRESVEHEIKSGKSLLNVLKRQNAEKSAGKDIDISVIEGTITDASDALNAGKVSLASELIREANAMTKNIIASMQTSPAAQPAGAAVDTTPRQRSVISPADNLQKDYAKRKNTVIALLDSAKRIDVERGTAHPAFAKTEAMIVEADKLAAAGNVAEGKAQLDSAYSMLKEAMREMLSRKKGGK